jgi:hypothetical protein
VSAIDDLRNEYAAAQSQGRATDMTRIKKQLLALNAEPAEPQLERAEKKQAAEKREPETKPAEPPRGRSSRAEKQSKS